MTVNDEMRIPYVSKEICKYLRETYNLPMVLSQVINAKNADIGMGRVVGINEVIERLEAITVQQEENDGIN